MADGLVPGATWVQNPRNGGGTYAAGYPWRICLHTIEGALGTLSASLPGSHAYPPHLWVDPSTRKLYQTVPLTRSAFALYQGDGPYTNKARALQVEIAGHAATAGTWPDEWLTNIAADVIVPFVDFVRSQGSDINFDNVPPIGAIGGSASEHAPQRLTYQAWTDLDGLCTHRHVPDNDHWDSGTLNVPRLVEITRELLGSSSPATPTKRRRGVDFNLRQSVAGVPDVFAWPGMGDQCVAYDCPWVAAGMTVSLLPSNRWESKFNVVFPDAVKVYEADFRPVVNPVKADGPCTVIVPANVRARIVAV
jgi:hypothetical protein